MATKLYDGIDVSKYQGEINWASVKSHIDFVIVKVGYRGYGFDGIMQKDAKFDSYMKDIVELDIPYGFYFFSQAKNAAEGKAEAIFTYNIIKNYKPKFPVFIDSEYGNNSHTGRADNISKEDRTNAILAFCDELKSKNFYPGLYCSRSWVGEKLNASKLTNLPFWMAAYTSTPGTCALTYNMWQYSSNGSIAGIPNRVDVNYCYADYPNIIARNGYNNLKAASITTTAPTSGIKDGIPWDSKSKDYIVNWPITGSHIITAGYKYNDGSVHNAIDLRADYKQPVYATNDGVVNRVYTWNGIIDNGGTNAYGNHVKIQHNEKYNGSIVETLYAHLDSHCVSYGQKVKAGDLIGYVGYTGHVIPAGINGKHLHFEVRLAGSKRNPLAWMDCDFKVASSAVYTFAPGQVSALRKEPSTSKTSSNGGSISTTNNVTTTTSTASTVSGSTATKYSTAAAKYYDKSLSATYKLSGNVNIRNGPNTSYSSMKVLPNNTKVNCYGYYGKDESGNKWYYVQTTYDRVTYTGFMHSKYLIKVN